MRTQEENSQLRAEVEELTEELESLPPPAEGPQPDGEVLQEVMSQLVESKMAAAQHAYERDELKQQCRALRAEVQRVSGGGKKVAARMTSFEVKYEELRLKYDTDMRGLIDLKLEAAEARARIEDLEEELEEVGRKK